MKRYATIVLVHKATLRPVVTETIPLEKKGGQWVCPNGTLRTVHLGLHLADGEQRRIVATHVTDPRLASFTNYFVFVGQTEAEVDAFAAGCATMRAANELVASQFLCNAAFSDN